MGQEITLSEALNWKKQLERRHGELVTLRNENSFAEKRYFGAAADKHTERTPVYDAKNLDKIINAVNRELRLLDNAMKKTNASVKVKGYEMDEAVLGELL